MKYDSFKLTNPGVTVIYGGDKLDRERFVSFFLENNPGYAMSIHPSFEITKKPLFGRSPSIYKLMHKEAGKQYKDSFPLIIQKEIDATGRAYLIDRAPRALSGGQRLFFSLFFAALTGTRGFILRDDYIPGGRILAADFINWLKKYTGDAKVLWVTSCTEEELSNPIAEGDNAYKSVAEWADEIYLLKDWEITKQ